MKQYSRRDFMRTSSAAAITATVGAGCATKVATTVAQRPTSRIGKVSPGDTVTLGFIGVAGRATSLMEWFRAQDDVNIAAVCDVYELHRNRAVELSGGKATAYADFREVLERPEIDAVVIATPPHWHALMTVLACEAGKDVYCEKPMCLTPIEGRAMVKAARANNRITQVGTQIHAEENYHRVVEIVRSGILGKISAVSNVLALNEAPDGIGFKPDETPPPNLDWNMWLGPMPEWPFNWKKFELGQHRYFAEIHTGWLHEMGGHVIDLPYWALELGPPKTAQAGGGKFATNDMSTIPDTMDVIWEYDDMIMTWSNTCANSHGRAFHKKDGIQRRLGISFHGVNGTLLADYSTYELFSEGDRLNEADLPPQSLPRSPGHGREFVNSIKSRELPSCDVGYHYNVHSAMNLGSLAYKLKRRLVWDEAKGEIVGDSEANEAMQPHYRDPWKLPV